MSEEWLEGQLREAAYQLLRVRGPSDREAMMLVDIIFGQLGVLEEEARTEN